MSIATSCVAALQSVYSLCSTVAASASPPSIFTDTKVEVFYGPAPAQQYNAQILIGVTGVSGGKQEPRYIGAGRLEDFTISGIVWVAITDPLAPQIETASSYLVTLLNALDAQVVNDPTLGGTVLQSWLESFELTFDVQPTGMAAQIDFEVHVESQVN